MPDLSQIARAFVLPNPPARGLGLKRIFHRAIVMSLALLLTVMASGCGLFPEVRHKPLYHNPFPQLGRVAVLPFANQSKDPTLSGSRVSLAYYNELQSIPGFEVVPLGVVENQIWNFEQNYLGHSLQTPADFQQFAQHLGVDAVLQGSITDYDSYYPPRMTMKVNWYAANPGFHPIPTGYGLPWGTKLEEKIPEAIRLEAERELANAQLATQTPVEMSFSDSMPPYSEQHPTGVTKAAVAQTAADTTNGLTQQTVEELPAIKNEPPQGSSTRNQAQILLPPIQSNEVTTMEILPTDHPVDPGVHDQMEIVCDDHSLVIDSGAGASPSHVQASNQPVPGELPFDWPDPQGFIPAAPVATRPIMQPQSAPVISHMKAYNGHDEDFTERLSEYFHFRDDARFGGPHAYLQRSEDFIRFCCREHIVETLAARGGQLESRVIFDWPIDRYLR